MSWRVLILKYIPWVQSFEPHEFKVLNSKTWNESRVMIVLNIKNWNENRVVQLEENWTLEWKEGHFEPRNLGMKTFPPFLFTYYLFLCPKKNLTDFKTIIKIQNSKFRNWLVSKRMPWKNINGFFDLGYLYTIDYRIFSYSCRDNYSFFNS